MANILQKEIVIYALTGATTTGKTTLLRELQSLNLPTCIFVSEAATEYYEQHDVPEELRSSYQNQKAIQDLYMAKVKAAIEQRPTTIFTDSSPLSCIVYAMLGNNNKTKEKLIENISAFLPTYRLFLLLNPDDVDYKYDPTNRIRKETEQQRMQVHQNLIDVLTTLHLPQTLISGSVDERIHRILQIIAKE